MQSFFSFALYLHILGGAVGLLTLAVPLLAKKGGQHHKRWGWVFTAGMALAAASGLLITLGWLAWPLAAKPLPEGSSAAAIAEHLQTLETRAYFLGLISLLAGSSLWQSVRAVKRKRQPEPAPSRLDVAFPGALLLAAAAALAFGLARGAPLVMGFAVLSLAVGAADLTFVLRPLRTPMAWWYQHMAATMAAAITAVTAFLVTAVPRLLGAPESLAGLLALWLGPTVVAVPLLLLWIRSYMVRFRELPGASHRQARQARLSP